MAYSQAPGGSRGSISNRGAMYQIDFTAVNAGKQIASSKRRVRWRFGFANLDAVSAGQTGQDCRGEEHEVTIVWSVHSGKRIVIADGKEVHYSHSRNKTFDFSWTMRGNHVLKVIALAQPMTEKPNIRQYDFLVDGQSYFTFPKVFKLGLTPGSGSGSASRGGGGGYNSGSGGGGGYGGGQQQHNANYTPYVTTPSSGRRGGGGTARRSNGIASIEAPHNPEEEDAYLKQAIENSMLENISPKQNNRPAAMAMALPPSDAFLLDFANPAPVEAQTQAMVPVPQTSGTSSYASDIFGLAGGGVPAQQAPAYAALPPSTTAAYPPVAQAYPSQQQQQQQQPPAADPWGMASVQSALPVVAAEPVAAAAVSNPFGDMIAAPNQQPVPEAHNNFPSAIGSPPPVSIDTTSGPTDNVFASGLNTPASTIGFQSPIAQHQQQQQQLQPPAFGDIPEQPQQQYSLDPQQQQQQQQQAQQTMNPFGGAAVLDPPVAVPEEAEATPATGDPALLSMNVLSGQPQSLVTDDMKTSNGGTTLADQAYSKLVNMDAFDLVQSKEDTSERKNPFEAMNMPIGGGAIGGGGANNTASLADLMKTKKPTMEKKDIMAPPPPGALVLSNNQTGNFGGYGGMGGGMMQQQQPMVGDMGLGRGSPQPPMMQQQYGQQGLGRGAIGFGQQPPPIYGGGMNMMQQPTNGGAGGPPPLQQYGGQPTYGGGMQQQQPPSMQQYGQPPPSMQQQPTYGQQQQQPPPLQQQQQQPFGF